MGRPARELQQQCEALIGQAEALREQGRAAEALVRCGEAREVAVRLAEAEDEPDRSMALPLALDLASRSTAPIDGLLPAAGGDPTLRRVLQDCLDHHAQLLDRAGDQPSARQLREKASGLGAAS